MAKAKTMPPLEAQNPSGGQPFLQESRESYEQRTRAQRRFWSSLEECDWEVTFDRQQVIGQNKLIMARMQRWKPSMNKGGLLWGPVGTGKSTLCKCLINKWASQEYQALFIGMGKLLQRLRDTINNESTLSQQMERIARPHLLVIDDLGVEKPTEWAREQIFTLLEDRRTKGKVNFFTTNLHPKELVQSYGRRIADRIINEWCVVLHCDGESWRKMNRVDEW